MPGESTEGELATPTSGTVPTARWRAGSAVRLLRIAVPVALALGFAVIAAGGSAGWLHYWIVPLMALVTASVLAGLGMIVVRQGLRRRALRRLAEERGWRLASMGAGLPVAVGRGARQFTDRWTAAPFAGRNHGSVADLLTGEFGGRRFAVFTYSYGERGGGALLGVTVVGLPVALPRLQVSPQGLETWLVPGLPDVDLESEAFNRRFRVRADDRRYAVDVLNPRAMAAMLSVPPCTLRIDGSDLLALGDPTGDPDEIVRRLEALSAIADSIPSFVLSDRRTGPAVPLPGRRKRRKVRRRR